MNDKKDRGVVDSIAHLRHLRYMTKGPGAAKPHKTPPAPTVAKLRDAVAKIPAKKSKAKKAKKRSRR